jgi:hypothetical protein
MQTKLLGLISVDFDIAGQLLIIYSPLVRFEKKWENNRIICKKKKEFLHVTSHGDSWEARNFGIPFLL